MLSRIHQKHRKVNWIMEEIVGAVLIELYTTFIYDP